MQLVFMGTPEFAVPSLYALDKAGHQVLAVVTQPDRPSGRGRKLRPSPVKQAALDLSLPLYQPEKVKEPQWLTQFTASFKPQVVVVVAFGQILPQAILAWPGKGCINVHASLLPHYRGAAPIQRAVMNGETKTGITTMLMEEGLDSGPMLLQTAIEISPQDTGGEIHDRLSLLGADLLVETLNQWEKGQLVPQPQDNTQSTYAAMLHAEDERIDWGNPAIKIYNQVRGLHPWSGGRTLWGDKILKIWRTQMLDQEVISNEIEQGNTVPPGTVLKAEPNALWVSTGTVPLSIQELQLQGGKRLPSIDFLRGNPIEIGTCWGDVRG